MIIEKVHIKKFRGFVNQEFGMGEQLTVIAGQNGTQKTTLLGMLSQPFSLRAHATMRSEKPLCGGSFVSSFAEKFKLSPVFDRAGDHEWTLCLHNTKEPFTLESIKRAATSIRFWRKGSKAKGTGYIQLPVVFLSLKRLFPIGEDAQIRQSNSVILTDEEKKLYQDLHNYILISHDRVINTDYLESSNKNTLGVSTDIYDWYQNSAGQDNVGKIILALLSFQRLKNRYQDQYHGGLLVIDEIDATMYSGSQYKLIEVLRRFSSKLSLQIIFTSHSLSILEKVCELQAACTAKKETSNQVKVLFLEKLDNNIEIKESVPFATIKNRLDVTVSGNKAKQIEVYTEDKEAMIFAKKLLRGHTNKLKFINVTISCSALIDLVYRKIPHFVIPNSMIILDGDVRKDKANQKKIGKAKNVLLLPSSESPERAIANMLYNMSDHDSLWTNINPDYTKQVCFRDYSIEQIRNDRVSAKEWFNQQKDTLGDSWCAKTIVQWKRDNDEEFKNFKADFIAKYNNFAKELGINPII